MQVNVEFDNQEYGQRATIRLETAKEVEMFWELVDASSETGISDEEYKFQQELLLGKKN